MAPRCKLSRKGSCKLLEGDSLTTPNEYRGKRMSDRKRPPVGPNDNTKSGMHNQIKRVIDTHPKQINHKDFSGQSMAKTVVSMPPTKTDMEVRYLLESSFSGIIHVYDVQASMKLHDATTYRDEPHIPLQSITSMFNNFRSALALAKERNFKFIDFLMCFHEVLSHVILGLTKDEKLFLEMRIMKERIEQSRHTNKKKKEELGKLTTPFDDE